MTVTRLHTHSPLPELGLPPGHWHGRLWVSERPLDEPDRYPACVAAHPDSGLWPVLIPGDLRFELGGEDWILDRDWIPPARDQVPGVDAAATLAGWWGKPCCAGHCLDPFGAEFPGLARRTPRRADPLAEAGNTGSVLARQGNSRLGLVATERPADIPALLGWPGMINTTRDVAAISAVLRSWEDRFGAVLLSLGFDTLELSVAAPPKTPERALVTAAEHRAFCLENFTSRQGDLREFADDLLGVRLWRFWWD
ncbi:DUF4253 domain-containing protein [Amycolatopsis cihanbeyliensis]|uniref:Uncharacterized protein DUF4253 n=1 Tax=Amycolatopsis cihanbeyliensis TaxID=1128664 RepID=A0A542DIW0_AMYCI|nr:DUF4253 domain-containing protein [Amycolatopsis cihanbeyliensis]TQJ02944.1 uncharacterized protein DUF4253 [Amycolatopsis cihanbeyliensis]